MTFRDANAHPMTDYFDFRKPAFAKPPKLQPAPGLGPGLAKCHAPGAQPAAANGLSPRQPNPRCPACSSWQDRACGSGSSTRCSVSGTNVEDPDGGAEFPRLLRGAGRGAPAGATPSGAPHAQRSPRNRRSVRDRGYSAVPPASPGAGSGRGASRPARSAGVPVTAGTSGGGGASAPNTSSSVWPSSSASNCSFSIVSRLIRISESFSSEARLSVRMSLAWTWAVSTIRRISSSISRAISSE